MGLFSKLQSNYVFSAGLLASLCFASVSQATVVLNGTPTGASSVITVTEEDGSSKTTIYGGLTGSTCKSGSTLLCNTCTGQPYTNPATSITYQVAPCNPNGIKKDLRLYMEFTVTNSAVTSSTNVVVKVGENTVSSGQVSSTYNGGTLSVSVPWGALCSKGAANGDDTCNTGFAAEDLIVGFTGIGGASSSEDLSTGVSIAVTSVGEPELFLYKDCDTVTDPSSEPTFNTGFCHFQTYPGDEKIYADNLFVQPSDYPSSSKEVPYRGVVFFYEEQTGGETNAQTLARITNASPMTTISLNTRANPPLGDNRITGLKNGTTYCFVMANQDVAGNIYLMTDIAAIADNTQLCGTPERVVGLLDDKSCFIATAAWGSDMAPEVQSFRDFRNKFLFSNDWGKSFVRFYYKHSPYFANMIAHSDAARGVVRVGLWPILFFAKFSVAYGLWAGLLLIFAMAGSVVVVYRRVKGLPKSRGVA